MKSQSKLTLFLLVNSVIEVPFELEIIYRDEWLIAINKPSGMLVHRSWLDKGETRFVMQTLRDQIGQHVFPLHRLDRPTSGVLLFALSSEIAGVMMPKFAEHEMVKTYHAVVRGFVKQAAVLDYPLKVIRDKIADKFATSDVVEQAAVTEYCPLAYVEVPIALGRYQSCRYSLVEMKPKTGRKHQLRRHMHHLSHHIIGDVNYGDGKHNRLFRQHFDSHRLLLHASSLCFEHPISRKQVTIHASIDSTWQRVFMHLAWSEDILKDKVI